MSTNKSPSETSLFHTLLYRLASYLSGTTKPVESTDEYLPLSVSLRLLTSERRRLVLEELAAETNLPISLTTLVERVACAEYDCSPEDLDSSQRNRVYAALYQCHIPAFAEADVLITSEKANLVDIGPAFPSLLEMYEAIKGVTSQ
jgi:hypothetical protein